MAPVSIKRSIKVKRQISRSSFCVSVLCVFTSRSMKGEENLLFQPVKGQTGLKDALLFIQNISPILIG